MTTIMNLISIKIINTNNHINQPNKSALNLNNYLLAGANANKRSVIFQLNILEMLYNIHLVNLIFVPFKP